MQGVHDFLGLFQFLCNESVLQKTLSQASLAILNMLSLDLALQVSGHFVIGTMAYRLSIYYTKHKL